MIALMIVVRSPEPSESRTSWIPVPVAPPPLISGPKSPRVVLASKIWTTGSAAGGNPRSCVTRGTARDVIETPASAAATPSSLNIRSLTAFSTSRSLAAESSTAEKLHRWVRDLYVSR